MARRYHPDLQNPEGKLEAEAQMKSLNEAYAVLMDPSRRRTYDRKLDRAFARNPAFFSRSSRNRTSLKAIRRRFEYLVDLASATFLMVGGFLVFVVWYPLYSDIRNVWIHPYEFITLVVWFLVLGRVLFRLLPYRRFR
jgi:curved DNA-binding protein CbpA